jgi:hypothetical protein
MSSAIFAAVLLVPTSAFAALGASHPESPKLSEATEESVSPMSDSELNEAGFVTSESNPLAVSEVEPMAQVNSVSQLSDVQPTDWAFQALQNLVERYGCIAGYPNGTFRGDRAMTRYEFAAGLNACLERITQLIAPDTTNFATKEDFATLQRLQQEFAAELTTLRGRVDALETRTAQLEAKQFSTTTTLSGSASFVIRDSFGGENVINTSKPSDIIDANANTVLNYGLNLDFLTSFFGQDSLRIRLKASNSTSLISPEPLDPVGSDEGLLDEDRYRDDGIFDEGDISGDDDDDDGQPDSDPNPNSVGLSLLDYRFPVGNNAAVNIFAAGGRHSLYARRITEYRSSPIYGIGGNGAGIGLTYNISDAFQVDLGYIARSSNNPDAGAGLFNGNYSALGQLVFQPSDRFELGLTYVHGFTRTGNLNLPAAGGYLGNLVTASDGIESDSYGIEASYRVSERFIIGGWVSFTHARLVNLGEAEIWNYAVTLGFLDLGKEGNLGILTVGVEPTLKGLEINNSSVGIPSRDENLYVEASYKYALTDNISMTTGLKWQPALFQTSENDDVFIGSLRTNFSF